MKKNKKLLLTSIVVAIALISVFLAISFRLQANVLIKFSIHPTVHHSSYYLVLYDDATLKCFYGERGTDDIQADKFMRKIRKYAKTRLNEHEFTGLIALADELIASGFSSSDTFCDDWYYVALIYNGTAYREVYQHSQSEYINQLVEDFLRLAPMSIELRGWL
jgi:hypothetical protein